ncbi:hypothetical protein ACOSQ2_011172 [Xanthoceras sorbifolium]
MSGKHYLWFWFWFYASNIFIIATVVINNDEQDLTDKLNNTVLKLFKLNIFFVLPFLHIVEQTPQEFSQMLDSICSYLMFIFSIWLMFFWKSSDIFLFSSSVPYFIICTVLLAFSAFKKLVFHSYGFYDLCLNLSFLFLFHYVPEHLS